MQAQAWAYGSDAFAYAQANALLQPGWVRAHIGSVGRAVRGDIEKEGGCVGWGVIGKGAGRPQASASVSY